MSESGTLKPRKPWYPSPEDERIREQARQAMQREQGQLKPKPQIEQDFERLSRSEQRELYGVLRAALRVNESGRREMVGKLTPAENMSAQKFLDDHNIQVALHPSGIAGGGNFTVVERR